MKPLRLLLALLTFGLVTGPIHAQPSASAPSPPALPPPPSRVSSPAPIAPTPPPGPGRVLPVPAPGFVPPGGAGIPGMPGAAPPLSSTPAVTEKEGPRPGEKQVTLFFPANPVTEILDLYERWTGKTLIRDVGLAGQQITIVVAQPISMQQAISVIETSLLLNGYTLVPGANQTVKILNSATKMPKSEAVPLYASEKDLPPGEEVVSYYMQLQHIAPDEAMTVFSQHAPSHTYGVIVPVQNAQALVVTDNAEQVRRLIDLQKLIDVPPAKVVTEFVKLERADAERVAEILNELVERDQQTTGTPGRGGTRPVTISVSNPNPANVPNAPQLVATTTTMAQAAAGPTERSLTTGAVRIVADARSNRILVISRPNDLEMIKKLIAEFDTEVTLSKPYEHVLKYVAAGDVIDVLADTLEEEISSATGVPGQPGGAGRTTSTGQSASRTQRGSSTRTSSSTRSSSSRSSSTGRSGSSLSGGGGITGADLNLEGPRTDIAPEAVIVGKTRLIADKASNSILVIGTPESVEKVQLILERLDRRPAQVFLATTIGQLSLGDETSFGIDILQPFRTFSPGGSSGAASTFRTREGGLIDPRTLTDTTALIGTAESAYSISRGLSLYGVIGDEAQVFLESLQKTDRFKVISRPAIYTQNNKEALISSGQRVPIPAETMRDTTNADTITSNVEFEDVVLELRVVPLINPENEVTLQIAQKNDSIIGNTTIAGENIPIIATEAINTTVTLPNRSTVVLGGLVTTSVQKNKEGLPWVSRIPLLGYLFGRTSNKTQRDELIVMIQPTVLNNADEQFEHADAELSQYRVGDESWESTFPRDAQKPKWIPVTPDPSPPLGTEPMPTP